MLFIVKFDLSVLIVKICKLFILNLGLIFETLVLSLNVALNFRDVLLSLEEGSLAEVFQELSILLVDALLLPFQVLSTLLHDLAMLTQ